MVKKRFIIKSQFVMLAVMTAFAGGAPMVAAQPATGARTKIVGGQCYNFMDGLSAKLKLFWCSA